MSRLLACTLSALLVAALPARGDDAAPAVTVPALQTMVTGMGLTDAGDKKEYVQVEHQGGRDLTITLQPVEDGKYLSLFTSLGEIAAAKLAAAPAEKMLEWNDTHRFYFTIGGDPAKSGYLQTRIDAAAVSPKTLRGAIDELIEAVDETNDIWDQDKWAGAAQSGAIATGPSQGQAKDYPALQTAADDAWEAAPLAIKTAVFAKDKVPGFGAYEVRGSSQFKNGDVVHAYVEPVYFQWKRQPGNKYGIDLWADILIQTKAGGSKVIDQKHFLHLAEGSPQKLKNVDMTADITLEDSLAATDYVITLTIHDDIGNKVASVDMPFSIVK